MKIKRAFAVVFSAVFLFVAMPFSAFSENTGKLIKEGYYEYIISDNKATIIRCDKFIKGNIVIPSELSSYTVVGIGDNAFED